MGFDTIPEYGKLATIDFLTYENIFPSSSKKDVNIEIFPTHEY